MTARKSNLKNPIYHDDDAARAHLEALLWPYGPVCPRCGVTGDRITKLQGQSTRPGVHKCKDCRKPFTVTVGTVMERSKVSLSSWVLAAHFMASSKKGMSAKQLQRLMGCTYETAWFLFHRLREAARPSDPGPLGGPGRTVEADETYMGGKEGNKHANKRAKDRALAADRKEAVLTLVERGGFARSFHVASVTAKTLRNEIVTNVHRSSHLMTDGAAYYVTTGREFAAHSSVDHVSGEYVRGEAHSNTAEGYFAILKRGVYGTFHHVSPAHLHRYLAEFDFRYSYREAMGVDDDMRAAELLRGAKGKRLYYRQPGQAAHA